MHRGIRLRVSLSSYNTTRIGLALLCVTTFLAALVWVGASWWQVLFYLGAAYLLYTMVLLLGDRREATIARTLLERIGEPFPADVASDLDLTRTVLRVRKRSLSAWIAPHEHGVIVHRPFRVTCIIPTALLRHCPITQSKSGATWWMLYRQGEDRLRILDQKSIFAGTRQR